MNQKIRDLLHVDFKKWHSHSELRFVWILSYVIENVTDTSRDYATLIVQLASAFVVIHVIETGLAPEYSVGLAWPSLAISHHNAIEAIKHVLNHRVGDLLIGLLLLGGLIEHTIEEKVSLIVVGSD